MKHLFAVLLVSCSNPQTSVGETPASTNSIVPGHEAPVRATTAEPAQPEPTFAVSYLATAIGQPQWCRSVSAKTLDDFRAALHVAAEAADPESVIRLAMQPLLDARIPVTLVDACPTDGVIASCKGKSGALVRLYGHQHLPDIKTGCVESGGSWSEVDDLEARRPIDVDAAALQTAYATNEVRADQQYRGKRLAVSGKVAKVGKDALDRPFLGLATKNRFVHVVATGVSSQDVAQLNPGEQVTVVCTGAGMSLGSATLDCSR